MSITKTVGAGVSSAFGVAGSVVVADRAPLNVSADIAPAQAMPWGGHGALALFKNMENARKRFYFSFLVDQSQP